jgi:hypothetical protein
MWPAQKDEQNTLAVLDIFERAGLTFRGEVLLGGAPYWLFKKPVLT